MNHFEKLEEEAIKNNIDVISDYTFESKRIKGLYCNGTIAINKKLSQTEKTCVLAEELGHHYTAVGDITCQKDAENRKQELRGRIISYDKLVGLNGIVAAYKHGCYSLHDTAEYLEVTEEFLNEALLHYKDKYGVCTTINKYVIYFEPAIGVLEIR